MLRFVVSLGALRQIGHTGSPSVGASACASPVGMNAPHTARIAARPYGLKSFPCCDGSVECHTRMPLMYLLMVLSFRAKTFTWRLDSTTMPRRYCRDDWHLQASPYRDHRRPV